MTTAAKPSRRQREGQLGLFIVATLAVLVGLVMWVENISFNANRYRFQIAFSHASGLSIGAAVRLRGVDVGRVVAIQADANQVLVTVEIADKNTIIPKNSRFRTLSGGLVSQTVVDITPKEDLDGAAMSANPRSQDCDTQAIVCQGARLQGQTSPTFDDLIQATAGIVKQFDNSEILDDLAELTQGLGGLTQDFKQLTREARASFQELQAAAREVERAGVKVGTAADATTGLIRINQESIRSSLVRLNSTLDTAKSTFTAFRKVATDLDQITGDPQIREDLKKLIRGLGKFISLSEEMRWHLEQIAQANQGQADSLQ